MKPLSAFTYLLSLFFLVFIFVSCDTDENPVGTLEEAVERIPDIDLIAGAYNATKEVRYDRNYSLFQVTLTNTGNSERIKDGTYYAWCLQLGIPIDMNEQLDNVRLYSTDRDKLLNKLSYIVNNRDDYEQAYPGLSWKDIQVAFWVILETKDMRLDGIVDFLPSSVEGYNTDYVHNILNDVKQNGNNFKPGFGDTHIIMTSAENQQDTGCETAFGGDTYGGDTNGPGGAWWFYFDTQGNETQIIWAGQNIDIGTVTVSAPDNGNRTITLHLTGGWELQDVNEPVKIQGYNDGEFPDSRPASGTFTTYKGDELSIVVPDFDYYVIHLDVCKKE